MEELYTVREASQILKFKERTIRSWVEQGKIKTIKIFNNIRIPQSEIERLTGGK